MKKKFTFLIAALMLLTTLAIPMGMRGQSTVTFDASTDITANAASYQTTELTINAHDGSTWKANGYGATANTCIVIGKGGANYLETPSVNGNITSVAVTWSGNANYYLALQTISGTELEAMSNPSSSETKTFNVSGSYTQLRLVGRRASGTSNAAATITKVVVTYSTGGTPTTYTVTYDANGGTGTMTDSNSPYTAGATVTVLDNAFTRTDYDFDHWNTAADDSGTSYDEDDTFTINANTTLYAQWTAAQSGGSSNTITITQNEIASFTNTYAWYDWTANGISGKVYAYKNSGMQFNSSKTAYWIYNTTAIPGRITSIKMTKASGTDRSWTLKVGNETLTTTSSGTAMGNSQTVGTSGATWTVTGNYTHFLLYVSGGATTISSIEVTYEASTDPSITANNENITYDATSGSITYTINNEPSPAGTLTAAVTEGNWLTLGQGTTSPIAFTCSANENTTERTATVTLTYTYGDNETVTANVTVTQAAAPVIYSTIPALFDAATSTETGVLVTFNNWVVSGVSLDGKSVFVTDNAGNGFVIYNKDGGLSNTYTAGNILSGTAVSCTLKKFNGFTELINVDAASLTFTTGGTVTAANVALADLAGVNTGALVHYDNLTCSITDNKYYLSDGTTTLQVYNALYAFDALTAGKTYTITGVYQQYNSTKEILPRSAADIEEVVISTPTITVASTTINATSAGADGTLNVEYENITDVVAEVWFCNAEGTTHATYDWITAEVNNDNDVYYLIDANNGAARTAYFKVYALDDEGEDVYSNIVTVTQDKYVPTPTSDPYVRIGSLDYLTDGSIVVIAARYDGTANAYYAMHNTTSGKPTGVAFTSTADTLPASIVTEQNDFYWIVNVTNGEYTFTNANGDMIGYGTSGTEFQTNNHTAWTIERKTSGENAMVGEYTGFVIKNVNTDTRAFALNNSNNFGPYSTSNMASSGYNFNLDFFVQTADETHTLTVKGYGNDNTVKNGWNLIASPVATTPDQVANMLTAQTQEPYSYDLYRFNAKADDELVWENYHQHTGDFNIVPGQGYLYANANNVTLSFTGTPYTGDGVITMVNEGWNLVGNPYYNTTTNIGRDYYRMNSTNNGLISATSSENVNAWEGIFVVAEAANETVKFTKVNPDGNAGSGNNNSSVVMNLTQNRGGVIDRAIVRFGEGRTLSKFELFENSTKLYIAQDGQDYAIVSAEAQGETPVCFKANTDGVYTITVNTENVQMGYLHLIDNMTGADVDLLATPSYTFSANTTDYASRFRLVFKANDVNDITAEGNAFAFITNGQLIIANEGEATLQVVDITGRVISTESVNGSCSKALNAPAGVYVLRLTNGETTKTQKIVIK